MLEIIIPIGVALLFLLLLWWKREWLLRMARRNDFLRERIDHAAAKEVLRQKDQLPEEAQRMLRGSEEAQVRALQDAAELAEQGRTREAAERLRQKPRSSSDGRQREKKKQKERQKKKAAKRARRRSR